MVAARGCMSSAPLTPGEIERLLEHDPRTPSADLLALRDALVRMGDACDGLASALHRLEAAMRADMPAAGEVPPPKGPPPRAD